MMCRGFSDRRSSPGTEVDYVLVDLRNDADDGRVTTTVVVRRDGVEPPVVGGVPLFVRFD